MRKKTNRKVWKLIDPIKHAIEGAAITPRHLLDQLLLRELAALDDLSHGRGSLAQWHDMASLVNICETMAHENLGAQALPDCALAQEALIEAAGRFERTGRMGLSGTGIKSLRDVIEWHDLQRSSIARSVYERMIRLTVARVKSGHNTIDVNEIVRKATSA